MLSKLREEVSPSISKAAARCTKLDELAAATAEEAGGTKEKEEEEAAGPVTLMTLCTHCAVRGASLGGDGWVCDAACESRLAGSSASRTRRSKTRRRRRPRLEM